MTVPVVRVRSLNSGLIYSGESGETTTSVRVTLTRVFWREATVMVTLPVFLAVTRPRASTLATRELLLLKVKWLQALAG